MKRFDFSPKRRVISQLSDLSRVERLVLEHVTRYRMTTRRGWRGAWELRDFDHQRLAKAVRRLVGHGILQRRVLYGAIHYFQLDVVGTKLLSLPPPCRRPLSPEALYRAYAHLLYATTGARPLVLANRVDSCRPVAWLMDQSPGNPFIGLGWGFFFDPDEATRWSQLLIDRSMRTNPNRVAQRLRDAALRLRRHPVWSHRLEEREFTLATITPSRRRAERIQTRFSRYADELDVPLKIMIAPGLIPLANDDHDH